MFFGAGVPGEAHVTEAAYRGFSARNAWGVAVLAVLVPLAFCCPVEADEEPEAYIMRVAGPISQALAEAVKRKIESAEEQGVKTFILELDTPGGGPRVQPQPGRFRLPTRADRRYRLHPPRRSQRGHDGCPGLPGDIH